MNLATADANLGDPAALDLEHLDGKFVDLERLADVRHASEVRQQKPAEGLEALALDLDAQPVAAPRRRSLCR